MFIYRTYALAGGPPLLFWFFFASSLSVLSSCSSRRSTLRSHRCFRRRVPIRRIPILIVALLIIPVPLILPVFADCILVFGCSTFVVMVVHSIQTEVHSFLDFVD